MFYDLFQILYDPS